MLYDPARHEALRTIPWDEDRVRATIAGIVADAEARYSPEACWPLHPRDLEPGEAVWAAGPLTKGSNLCHGTGGNGYALLKLYQRSGDARWLDRARAFAMHGIEQMRADAAKYGQLRYSLWTGDPGFAIYLWDCVRGEAAFPTLDRFWA